MVNVKVTVETRCNTDGGEEAGEVKKSAPINEGGYDDTPNHWVGNDGGIL